MMTCKHHGSLQSLPSILLGQFCFQFIFCHFNDDLYRASEHPRWNQSSLLALLCSVALCISYLTGKVHCIRQGFETFWIADGLPSGNIQPSVKSKLSHQREIPLIIRASWELPRYSVFEVLIPPICDSIVRYFMSFLLQELCWIITTWTESTYRRYFSLRVLISLSCHPGSWGYQDAAYLGFPRNLDIHSCSFSHAQYFIWTPIVRLDSLLQIFACLKALRIGEAGNPGPDQPVLTLKSIHLTTLNPTAI